VSRSQISVCVATFGDELVWNEYAKRALVSVDRQSRPPDQVVRVHSDTLQNARNEAVRRSDSEWIVCLDADDELDQYYLASMLLASGDIRYPRIKYICEDGREELLKSDASLLCVGCMFRKSDFEAVGGFWNEPILEDYSLWTRMQKRGARVGPSHSIYIAHKRRGRNSDEVLKAEWMETIATYS
jgi:glycosyltransferase involved in cell wall biosynthesis